VAEYWKMYPQRMLNIDEQEYRRCAALIYSLLNDGDKLSLLNDGDKLETVSYYCKKQQLFVHEVSYIIDLLNKPEYGFESDIIKSIIRIMFERRLVDFLEIVVIHGEPYYHTKAFERVVKKYNDSMQETVPKQSPISDSHDNGSCDRIDARSYICEDSVAYSITHREVYTPSREQPLNTPQKCDNPIAVIQSVNKNTRLPSGRYFPSANLYLTDNNKSLEANELGEVLGLHPMEGVVGRSKRVLLFGKDAPPRVDGKTVNKLPASQYTVVEAFLERYPHGLTKTQIEGLRIGDGMDALKRLKIKEPWNQVIVSPGKAHKGGYRIC